MRGMLNVGRKRCLILELHDAAERIALSSRGNVGSHMRLKKSGDYPLEGTYLFRGTIPISFGHSLLPLKSEYVKDCTGRALRSRIFSHVEGQQTGSNCPHTVFHCRPAC